MPKKYEEVIKEKDILLKKLKTIDQFVMLFTPFCVNKKSTININNEEIIYTNLCKF